MDTKVLDGVYDNTETNRRERWRDGKVLSFLGKEEIGPGSVFPWGYFLMCLGEVSNGYQSNVDGRRRHEGPRMRRYGQDL